MHRPTNIITMSIFLCIFWLFLGGIHFFVYMSWGEFFALTHETREILFWGFLGLSLSFVVSSVLASSWDNRKTRYLYYLSAVWLGGLQYFFLSAIGVWGILFMGEYFSLDIPKDTLGFASTILSLVTVIYGIRHARVIQTKHVRVAIRNLPLSWHGRKIVHISDVHVGHILRASFVRKIVKHINTLSPDMVAITGDLFDGMDGRLEHLVDPLSGLTAPLGVYYVDGNHETYLGVDRALRALAKTGVRILRDEIITIDGLDLIGIEYSPPGVRKDIAKTIMSLPNWNKDHPSILLYHTPHQIRSIARTGVDLELCGHTHKGQMWPHRIITWLVHRGYDYGLSHIGDYTLYTSSGVGTWGPPLRVGSDSEVVVITVERK